MLRSIAGRVLLLPSKLPKPSVSAPQKKCHERLKDDIQPLSLYLLSLRVKPRRSAFCGFVYVHSHGNVGDRKHSVLQK